MKLRVDLDALGASSRVGFGQGGRNGDAGSEVDLVGGLTIEGEVTFVCDGDGNRVAKTVTSGGSATTTTYLIDDAGGGTGYAQGVEERSGGAVQKSYVYGLGLISQRDASDSLSFFTQDGSMNVRALSEGSGSVTDSWDYDAFGTVVNRTGATANQYLFADEYNDPDLGLLYLRARWMDEGTGRFLSRDTWEGPLATPWTNQAYDYAWSRPINVVDPSGKEGLLVQTSTATISLAAITRIILPYLARAVAPIALGLVLGTTVSSDEGTRRRLPCVMRVQLQHSLNNGKTDHTDAIPLGSPDPPGVTVSSVQVAGLAQLYAVAQALDWFPVSENRSLRTAIVKVSEAVNKYPPGGVSGVMLSLESSKWPDSQGGGKTYHVDLDQLSGWNLRQ